MKAVAVGGAAPLSSGVGAPSAMAATPLNVAVVGGGMAGATAAKYLRYWGKKLGLSVNVTLFEPNAAYISNIKSNEVLIGLTTLSTLTYKYDTLKSTKYGVVVRNVKVNYINPATGTLYSSADATGTSLGQFNVIILAAGLQFDYSTILRQDETGIVSNLDLAIPHAWQAGPQTTALQSQLKNMVNGNNLVISIPPKPYRCPPGPYERACVIADWMKKNKPLSKVLVLDANSDKQAEKPVFDYAFDTIHAGYITYTPNTKVTRVVIKGAREKWIYTAKWDGATWVDNADPIKVEIANIIPPMKAPPVVLNTLGPDGLDQSGRWALISEQTYQSTKFANIYVIGDGIFSQQPKAGHIGNQEAKICADAILRRAMGIDPYPKPMTNSACFTPITTTAGPSRVNTATWLTALYRYDPNVSPPLTVAAAPAWPASARPSSGLYSDMKKWFAALMQDTFA
jgi:NADPH-dependent 2,4-dienoyl-CoA reductase/sulfur reductase-like enzyme